MDLRRRDGHLQATGRDARGRKQYRYHAGFGAPRAAKFDALYEFGTRPARRSASRSRRPRLPGSRARRSSPPSCGCSRRRSCASATRSTRARTGRTGSRRCATGTRGFTATACDSSSRARRHRRERHGQDRRLRRVVKQCQDLPGQVLFQYLDDDGDRARRRRPTSTITCARSPGAAVTAKDFRTWTGTLLATVALAELAPTSERAAKRAVNRRARGRRRSSATRLRCAARATSTRRSSSVPRGLLAEQWDRASPGAAASSFRRNASSCKCSDRPGGTRRTRPGGVTGGFVG